MDNGDKLLVNLSNDLTAQLGKGYSKSNLFNMRLFFSRFPIFQTVSGKLECKNTKATTTSSFQNTNSICPIWKNCEK